ncbi:alpha/beta fold hydrolase [Mycolicibacterium llatzerense]|uniref:alpha/beta fold hydrolase n=1 Tax=Mycolicibacterium llatzerense TaxID=280871 RepID=UPI0021B570D9|nr:alpha/beta hydrolase [Mycolicibacterium llatzerense]MCT7371928.1 hypothetical protein [Mycolicibacterium llatzerense]
MTVMLAAPTTSARTAGRRTKTVLLRDGVQIAVSDNAPSAPRVTVVFLHGVCLGKAAWEDQCERLDRRYSDDVRVIAYDHRGHGKSSAAPMATYTIDQCARDLAEILAALHVTGPLVLVGHSMGAMVALSYLGLAADQRPVDPSGLVLVATAAGNLAHRGVGCLLNSPLTTGLFEAVAHTPDRALRLLVAPLGAALAHVHPHGTQRRALARVAASALANTPISTAVGFLPTLRTFDAYAVLSTVTAHTTVISGGLDVLTPPEHAREMAAAIPNCRHITLAGLGHMLPQEAPQVITDAIVRTIEHDSAKSTERQRMTAHRPVSALRAPTG